MCSFTDNQKENKLMPYIPTKQEEARQKKWKTEKERKDNILNTSFNKLTMKQQDAFKELWSALYQWDNELCELDGDCYASTERALRKTRWKLYHAFPNVTQRKEEDDV